MSKQSERSSPQPVGTTAFLELAEVGRRIELLRIARGLSKQQLSRKAATSRQQIWRVMTGKSELSHATRDRLAHALGVEPAQLTSRDAEPIELAFGSRRSVAAALGGDNSARLAVYLSQAELLEGAVVLLPPGADGVRLKRLLLNAVEDLALERSLALPDSFFDLRRRVLAGEL